MCWWCRPAIKRGHSELMAAKGQRIPVVARGRNGWRALDAG